ncbi:uncharacterized protein MONBRDRAFT_15322, partial [Monosiga brevicollis MX1]
MANIVLHRFYWSFKPVDPDADDERWERVHEFNARLVERNVRILRGFWVKVGQYMSSRGDVMPAAWVRELSKLQDAMPKRSGHEVRADIEAELGCPLDTVFTDFEDVALASASIAQVHRATLKTGQQVVCKVQHRNIQTIMKHDLQNLFVIVDWVAYFDPSYDFRPVLDEWSKVAVKELDFRNEMLSSERVRANMADAKLDVIVPAMFKKYCTERLLTMEFAKGFKVTDSELLDAHGIDREALMRRICQAFAHQVYVQGFFNCDPHPGNLLIQVGEDGTARPVLLDYGMCRELNDEKRIAFAR